jgi:hypothetical protein
MALLLCTPSTVAGGEGQESSREEWSGDSFLLNGPPIGACCSREYTPARSADKHLPEAHCRRLSIVSLAVTATETTFCEA